MTWQQPVYYNIKLLIYKLYVKRVPTFNENHLKQNAITLLLVKFKKK